MNNHRLAVYTFNQFVAPYLSDTIKGFRDAEPKTFAMIEQAEGFIARSGYDGEEGPQSWGEQVFPSCWENANADGWAPSTLSLWTSIETIMAATYHGTHGAVQRQGRKWHIQNADIPEYVIWWVAGDHIPDWHEAVEKLELLMNTGPTPQAFSFKKAFDPSGILVKPQASVIKEIAARNLIARR